MSSQGRSSTDDGTTCKPASARSAEPNASVKKEDSSAPTGPTSSINSDIPACDNKVSKKRGLEFSTLTDRSSVKEERPPKRASSANWESVSQQNTESTSTGSKGGPNVKEEDYPSSEADDAIVFSSSKGGCLTDDGITSNRAPAQTALTTPGSETTALVKEEDLPSAPTAQTSSTNSGITSSGKDQTERSGTYWRSAKGREHMNRIMGGLPSQQMLGPMIGALKTPSRQETDRAEDTVAVFKGPRIIEEVKDDDDP